jgi:glycosyltransferase involved in cell wall biosynthesis
MQELYIIVNEKIYNKNKVYFCENKDVQSIVNYFSLKYKIFLISRYSFYYKPFKLKKLYNVLNLNLLNFLSFFSLLNFSRKKKKILIISITPFNFIIFILLKFFLNCKFYLYLRSNGQEEYENILGKKSVFIYEFMFSLITRYSEIISCHQRLYNKKCHILFPSELTKNWIRKRKKNFFRKNIINILYIGRFKIEKGIYSLLNIFSQLPEYIKLTLVGNGNIIKTFDKRIKIVNFQNNESKLIKIYDSSNIVILPSFTEAYPKIVDEALSRFRPVIIFNNISYIVGQRKGVFIAKRNKKSLMKVIFNIKENYKLIKNDMKKNILPTKKEFLENFQKIIS